MSLRAMKFVRPRLMRWDSNAITDHNRSALTISPERIERKKRMANGYMRKYVIATKRTFACSWEMLPKKTSQTVDGYWGGEAIEDFYNSEYSCFDLEITDGDGTIETYKVMFTDFSKEIQKRGSVDFWKLSFSAEEV